MTHNLTGLLAQAYCTKENQHKIVDPTLLMAMDKIITDYLKGRAEWLLNQYNDHKEKDEIIREAFELPKEEKCECSEDWHKQWRTGEYKCPKCHKPIPSQPEKALPRKLNYIDKYPHPNHISLDVVCSQKIDEIIDYLQSLTGMLG